VFAFFAALQFYFLQCLQFRFLDIENAYNGPTVFSYVENKYRSLTVFPEFWNTYRSFTRAVFRSWVFALSSDLENFWKHLKTLWLRNLHSHFRGFTSFGLLPLTKEITMLATGLCNSSSGKPT
jgi:hypothetical protein